MARTVVTLRLEDSTRRRLAAVARRRGWTPSAVVRKAVEAWLRSEDEASGQGADHYAAIADLVGCVRGGDRNRSARGARRIAADLRARGHASRRRS